jgi:hypothetical protein
MYSALKDKYCEQNCAWYDHRTGEEQSSLLYRNMQHRFGPGKGL